MANYIPESPLETIKQNYCKTQCATQRGEEKYIDDFGEETPRKRPVERPRDRWGDNIKMGLKEIEEETLGWIHLAQDRDKWWVLLTRCSLRCGEFLVLAEELLASQKRVCSKELVECSPKIREAILTHSSSRCSLPK